MRSGAFAFHGVSVRVETDADELHAALERDFAWFRVSEVLRPAATLRVLRRPPPYGAAPDGRAVRVSPGCIVYRAGIEEWTDYDGRALCRFRPDIGSADLYSEDADLLHDAAHAWVLARVRELHDRRGLHRLEALGVARQGRGLVCLSPPGALAPALLKTDGMELLSHDAPLVTRAGELRPFPHRVDGSFPIAEAARPRAVVVAERRLRGPARVEPMSRAAAFPALARALAGGGSFAIVASRVQAATALLLRAGAYRLLVGRDAGENARLCAELL